MNKIVIRDKRFSKQSWSRKQWKTLVEYEGKNIPEKCDIPKDIKQHWQKRKEQHFGFADLKHSIRASLGWL